MEQSKIVWAWTVSAASGAPTITDYAPASAVTDTSGASITFNITVDQTVNVSWYSNGISVQNNTSVLSGIKFNTVDQIVNVSWYLNETSACQ